MSPHSPKLKAALAAVEALFGDTSVPRGTTKAELEILQNEIETRLETLDDAEWDEDE